MARPKTETSIPTIGLDHGTAALLRWLHARRTANQNRPPQDWVLAAHGDGWCWSPSYVTRTFQRQIAEADLPPVWLHDLRHGAASLSLAAGNELKVIQALLGHSSIVVIADAYTSVLPCLAHQAAGATARLVRHANATPGHALTTRQRHVDRCRPRTRRTAIPHR